MSLYYIDTEQEERTAVKTAVALSISRYRDTVGKFVQGKSDRLTLVEDRLARIARECAEVAKADPEEVERKFKDFLAAEVAVSEPEHQEVDQDYGPTKNTDEVPQPEKGAESDIKDDDAVLEDSRAVEVDMNAESTGDSNSYISKTANPNAVNCPYCGHTMTAMQNAQNPAMSGAQQQCPNCGATITAQPGQQGQPFQGQSTLPQTGLGGGLYAKTACERCEKHDAQEDSILCEACNEFVLTGVEKEAQPEMAPEEESVVPEDVQSPVEEDPNEPQLPPAVEEDTNGPAEVYTGVVERMANEGAAMAWSTPGDEDIRQISEQYGLDPEVVQQNLIIVADFGDSMAVNGDPNADPATEGMTELPSFGGRIPTTEEEVDSENAINATADMTQLSADDVYALVKESYGGDLGGQHYVSVSGEAHYYLPEELIGNVGPDVDSPVETPEEAVQSSVPAHLRSLSAYLEWEKARSVATSA